jgi:hypothetical protein
MADGGVARHAGSLDSRRSAAGVHDPGARLGVRVEDWRFSVGFFPSLLYAGAFARSPLRPGLGAGATLSFGHVTALVVAYLIADVLRPLVGAGYRI